MPLIKQTQQTGLSSPHVRKIIQDKYGFMWFATQDGLNRFDGTRYVIFNSSSQAKNHTIIGTDVYDLAFDSTGEYLWVLTAYGGLSRIDIKTCVVRNVHPVNSLGVTGEALWLKCMSIKGKFIFIGTNEGNFIRFNIVTGKIEKQSGLYETWHLNGQIDNFMLMIKTNDGCLFPALVF